MTHTNRLWSRSGQDILIILSPDYVWDRTFLTSPAAATLLGSRPRSQLPFCAGIASSQPTELVSRRFTNHGRDGRTGSPVRFRCIHGSLISLHNFGQPRP